MSIIGHLYHLALATPTMPNEIEDVETVLEGRLLQVVGKNGNATKAFMPKGLEEYARITHALDEFFATGSPQMYSAIGQDERGNNVPFTVVLADITMVMLFPPPSGLAVPSNISLLDPNRTRH